MKSNEMTIKRKVFLKGEGDTSQVLDNNKTTRLLPHKPRPCDSMADRKDDCTLLRSRQNTDVA